MGYKCISKSENEDSGIVLGNNYSVLLALFTMLQVKKLRNCAIDMPVVGQEEDKSDEESVDHEAIHTETLISDTRARADSSSNTMYSLPVSMNGKKTNIWIGEVEKFV